MPQHLRFFLSSPGDVSDERTFAQQVIEELPKDPLLRGELTCEVVRHDDPVAPAPMVATLTPQESVDRSLPAPSECDVVIVILWSRLGSTLHGKKYLKPDGTPYQSGTEWEFENAVDPKNRRPPYVLVYFRTSPPPFTAADEDFDEKSEQLRKLRQFLKRFEKVDGAYTGGYQRYESPQEFRDLLRSNLHTYVREHRGAQAPRGPSPLPPYDEIAGALAAGKVVPFIGPGVLACGRGSDAKWDQSAPKFLPSDEELSRFLAKEGELPQEAEHEHLVEVASFYETVWSRGSLRQRLRNVFGSQAVAQAAVPPLYTLLAELKGPKLVVTTNYDTLLERAFQLAGCPYDLIVYPAELKDLANAVLWWPHGASEPKTAAPNQLDVDLDTATVIFKMHGTIQPDNHAWDGTVITEADYLQFLARLGNKSAIPAVLLERMRDRSLLFLGFNVDEWNSRNILRTLKRRTSIDGDDTPSWAIAQRFSELELLLWRALSVYPFEMDLDEFARELRGKLPVVTAHGRT